MATMPPSSRGTLFPQRLPTRFQRVPADPSVAHLVGWWWISEWSLPPGESSTQQLLPFPVCNLVVEDDLVGFAGPTTRASQRVLVGDGWAVAALLRPAAVPAFTNSPADWRDRYLQLPEPELHHLVASASGDRAGAVAGFAQWLVERAGDVSEEALLANRMVELASDDASVTTLDDLARGLGTSQRTLHRLARRYVGLTPYAIIRRRRLQEAALQLREHPDDSVAEVAARHGFSDQAHFTREFRALLGRSPSDYRAELAATAEAPHPTEQG